MFVDPSLPPSHSSQIRVERTFDMRFTLPRSQFYLAIREDLFNDPKLYDEIVVPITVGCSRDVAGPKSGRRTVLQFSIKNPVTDCKFA